MYILSSISAQSWASVPPAPAWTSRKQSFPSASPESRLCRRAVSLCSASAASPAIASAAISSSPSASASSTSSPFSAAPSSSARQAWMALSSWVRSRMTFCAASGSFQRSGFSASAFSSSRRRRALSQSKMPPEQGGRFVDLVNQGLGFGAHGRTPGGSSCRCGRLPSGSGRKREDGRSESVDPAELAAPRRAGVRRPHDGRRRGRIGVCVGGRIGIVGLCGV